MADSNLTKLTLANALKELLEHQPFERISISDICESCGMNRKSFYYHFRDKFDLVNWIFDTEFIEELRANSVDMREVSYKFDDQWKNIEIMCNYFYSNRAFYRKVLLVEGQNSFSAHFKDFIRPLLQLRVEDLLGLEEVPQMVYDFVADGVLCSIERWLLDRDCVSANEFMYNLKKLIRLLFVGVERIKSEDSKWIE